jgi:hypothetical protein
MAFLFDPLPPDKQPLFRWVVTIGTVHIQLFAFIVCILSYFFLFVNPHAESRPFSTMKSYKVINIYKKVVDKYGQKVVLTS